MNSVAGTLVCGWWFFVVLIYCGCGALFVRTVQARDANLELRCGEASVFANHRMPRRLHVQGEESDELIERERGGSNDLPVRATSRVVGGKPSPEGAWPWMVSLQLLHPGLGFVSHLCGGVLVHPHWVVTAAHCIRNERYELSLAALWSAEFEGRRRVPVEEIIVHTQYAGFNHDIALVRLTRPAEAASVCLPQPGQSFLGVRCVASGWSGKPSNLDIAKYGLGSQLPLKRGPWALLMQSPERRSGGPPGPRAHTALSVVSSSACRTLYTTRYNLTLGPGHLCAGRGRLSAGTCLGDSGGPLQCNMGDGRWYLAGITSFGSGCGRPGYPDVFSRLAFYMPWIRQQIREHAPE